MEHVPETDRDAPGECHPQRHGRPVVDSEHVEQAIGRQSPLEVGWASDWVDRLETSEFMDERVVGIESAERPDQIWVLHDRTVESGPAPAGKQGGGTLTRCAHT